MKIIINSIEINSPSLIITLEGILYSVDHQFKANRVVMF